MAEARSNCSAADTKHFGGINLRVSKRSPPLFEIPHVHGWSKPDYTTPKHNGCGGRTSRFLTSALSLCSTYLVQ
jgi:hypothetical protein